MVEGRDARAAPAADAGDAGDEGVDGTEPASPSAAAADDALEARIAGWLAEGLGAKNAARRLASETGISSRAAYEQVLGVSARSRSGS